MHVARAETHICPFDQVEKISKCHLTERERERAPRDKCLYGEEIGDLPALPEWGDMEETSCSPGKGKVFVGEEVIPKGGHEA